MWCSCIVCVCVCVCVICTLRGGSLCSAGQDAPFGSGLLRPLWNVGPPPSAKQNFCSWLVKYPVCVLSHASSEKAGGRRSRLRPPPAPVCVCVCGAGQSAWEQRAAFLSRTREYHSSARVVMQLGIPALLLSKHGEDTVSTDTVFSVGRQTKTHDPKTCTGILLLTIPFHSDAQGKGCAVAYTAYTVFSCCKHTTHRLTEGGGIAWGQFQRGNFRSNSNFGAGPSDSGGEIFVRGEFRRTPNPRFFVGNR